MDQLWRLLAEHQVKSKAVALEAEDLKQRLAEAEGDNRALRYVWRRGREVKGGKFLSLLFGRLIDWRLLPRSRYG